MYVDEVVIAGIAAIGLCIAFFIGFAAFIVYDSKKSKREDNAEDSPTN